MRASDYGPVALSRLKAEQSKIYDALEAGRRVLIAHRGEIVAAMDPAPSLPRQVLEMYSMPQIDTSPYELTASVMNQGSPGPNVWLKRARDGVPALVTRGGKLYGALRALSPEDLAAESSSSVSGDQDDAIEKFIAANPRATADELADFTASLERQSIEAETPPYVNQLFGLKVRTARQRAAAVDRAYKAVFQVGAPAVDEDLRVVIKQASAG